MHDTHKQDYLAQAERHIAIAQDRIARQTKIIDELAQAGQETDCAVSMLHALETCTLWSSIATRSSSGARRVGALLSIEGEAGGIDLIDTHLNWSGAAE